MHFKDLLAAANIGQANIHLAVKTAGAQEGFVQYIGAVGGGYDNDAFAAFKAVHFHQQLVEGLLALIVAAAMAAATMATHGVNFVDKDNAGRLFLAWSNISRTREAPTPTNISTKSEPEIEKKGTFASPAMALARRVLPVPGGPDINTPRGIRPPKRWKRKDRADIQLTRRLLL